MARVLSRFTVALVILAYGVPLLLIASVAFRPEGEVFRYGTQLSVFSFVPQSPTVDGFASALSRADFVRQAVNTLVIGLIQTAATVFVCLMAAYALSRSRGRSVQIFLGAVGLAIFIPYQTAVVPLYLVVRDLGMLNNWWGLILPWVASPITVVMLKNAIDEVPLEIDEAARIDGAGPTRVLFNIVLPNIVPSLATVAVINMVGIYDSLLWPLVVINDPSNQVAQVGLASFFTTWERPSFSTAFAASLIVIAPLLPLIFLFQRQYAQTFATSGAK
jgi:ABC-type glycerol-3-phosphate transport system permease component